MLKRNDFTSMVIKEKLEKKPVGVIIKGVSEIDPIRIVEQLASDLNEKLYVCINGYNEEDIQSDTYTVSTKIEDAVDWRSTPQYEGKILVFLKEEVPKTHSLSEFVQVNTRDITEVLLEWAQNVVELSDNIPEQKFWDSLYKESDTFPLNLIEEFAASVYGSDKDINIIPSNMWRLGLLKDNEIVSSQQNASERLERNRNLLLEMGLLSEESRKRLSGVLSKASEDDRKRLKAPFMHLRNYYRTGSKEILKSLDLDVVEELLKASKPKKSPKKQGGRKGDTNKGNGPLKGSGLERQISLKAIDGSIDSQEGLKELGEEVRTRLRNSNQDGDPTTTVKQGFENQTIQLDLPNEDYMKFIYYSSNKDSWGGTLFTKQDNIKNSVLKFTPEDFVAYNPDNPEEGVFGKCLFSLLRYFDTLITGEKFSVHLNEFIESRSELLQYVDLIFYNPILAFGGYPEARESLVKYLSSYSSLLRVFRNNEASLHRDDREALEFVASELLRLDVIHIKTPSSWKAILSPLHPFHLWRYKELLTKINPEDETFTTEEKEQISQVIPDIPHMLHFLVFSKEVSGKDDVKLPLSGTFETLPTFENHTNRYLGNDGLDFIGEILDKYQRDAPYSFPQLRIGVVDNPDLHVLLKMASAFLKGKPNKQIVIDAYYTRNQKPANELARLDYDNKDYEIGELLKDGKIRLQFYEEDNLQEVCNSLENRPVNIAYLFDQSLYSIEHGPRAKQLIVSPLVVSYQYDYSKSFNRGTIQPSSEAEDGIFSDFHFLIERAAKVPAGQQIRLNYASGEDIEPINKLLSNDGTRWLAVADRSISGYSPTNSVLLSERQIGQREVALWTRASQRSVGNFIDLLKRHNLHPEKKAISELLSKYSHISSGGILSLLNPVSNNVQYRENSQKGFLGTVFAAAWYRSKYPNSLIASLDSKLARQWLSQRDENDKRADLIGLRIGEDGKIIVEPIEVKSRNDETAVSARKDSSGQIIISGGAIEQLKAMIGALEPIFGGDDKQPLFTPARREVLRYQLHRECFREIHDSEWQYEWYEKLKDAFSLPLPRTSIEIKGTVIQVMFENNFNEEEYRDSNTPIRLIKIGTESIQKLINNESSNNEVKEIQDNQTGNSDRIEKETILNDEHKDKGTPENTQYSKKEQANYQSPDNETDHVDNNQSPERSYLNDTSKGTHMMGLTVEETNESNDEELNEDAFELSRLFRRACQAYRIEIEECDHEKALVGPTVWRFLVKLARGQKLEPLKNSLEDIGREMRRSGLLINTIPNSEYIALDVPRLDRQSIPLTEGLLELNSITSPEQMPIIIGMTPERKSLVKDLSTMPHLLVGGTTGSGKTVFLYGIIASLLIKHPNPKNLRLMISTSKPEDFMFFEGLPHLENGEIISDADEAIRLLETRIKDTFDERLDLLKQNRCRDISEYNSKYPDTPLAPIVVIIDEFADLADQLSSDKSTKETFYTNVRRIAQLGRSRGIHLILCTQRPSRDLVPTNIRNLMNARVSLRVNDSTASRMILEQTGGEQLQLRGDLLYRDEHGLVRGQGYYISTDELEELIKSIIN